MARLAASTIPTAKSDCLVYATAVNINALGGDDIVLAGSGTGNGTLAGGDGNDTASYEGTGDSLNIHLFATSAQDTLGAGNDTLVNIENLIGSSGNDTLRGKEGVNRIDGGPGNHIIAADNANGNALHRPNAFSPNDVLVGGPGSDILVFNRGFADNVTIADLDPFLDRIDLRDFFANSSEPEVTDVSANATGVRIQVSHAVSDEDSEEFFIELAGIFTL